MPEVVFFCNKINSVCVDSFDVVTVEDVSKSIDECMKLFNEFDTKNLIVDVSKQTVTLDYLETFELCKNDLTRLPEDLNIAYVISNPPKQPHQFFKLITSNSGIRVKLFHDTEGAVKWLNEDDENESISLLEKIQFPSTGLEDFK